jgi:acyl-CoA synthetase (AMP-forming)/AMP-acid ligase II
MWPSARARLQFEGHAFAVPDDIGRLYVVPQPGSALAVNEIRDWCATQLADDKVPRQIVLRDAAAAGSGFKPAG